MAASAATADELRRAIDARLDALLDLTAHLSGQLGGSRGSLKRALALVATFPDALRDIVVREMARGTDPQSQVDVLSVFLTHINYVANFVEQHLTHGTRRELSESMVNEIRRELDVLGLSRFDVVVCHGAANNFETTHGNLHAAIFTPLVPFGGPAVEDRPFASFKMPRLEGAGVHWRPVVLGHEVAHLAVKEYGAINTFDLRPKFDIASAGGFDNPRAHAGSPAITRAMGLYRIAEAWATELICDAYALHRFGPSGMTSVIEYLLSIGAMEQLSATHPPAVLRLVLFLKQLGRVRDVRLREVVRPWRDLAPRVVALGEPWAQHLSDMFLAHVADLDRTAASFPSPRYSHATRSRVISSIADCFGDGVPGREVVQAGRRQVFVQDADVVNAAWVARSESTPTPVDSLAKKALESLDFVRRWTAERGLLPDIAAMATGLDQTASTLSAAMIADRLCSQERRVVVTPLLHLPAGAGIDLRLGNRFIVFRRAATEAFDPLDLDDDPRAIQSSIELDWTERFVLHPLEIVLGATLEYLVVPNDLTGQVITRSSYGRLGMLTATAVQVHPGFHGCLTLELVNLSTIPIVLTPGERIAQLILAQTAEGPPGEQKYSYPIGPEFSRVRDDLEADILRAVRSR